jgi:putative transposase
MDEGLNRSESDGALGITRPTRRRLYHTPPSWVEEGALFFVTINCKERGRDQLNNRATFEVIATAVEHYAKTQRWWCDCFLAMPDHVHALFGFPSDERMAVVIRDWKRFVAKTAAVTWQDGFFDHRLRADESVNETWNYIRENPVRKQLCLKPDDWPWFWTAR